jgi:SNF2 family DNA or RNA helicase
MITFRDYQKNIISDGVGIIKKNRFLYLAMEVRTGKTLTSLGICDEIEAKKVLFITKKKAISSIQNDYELLHPKFDLEVINYESLHKVRQTGWDVVICDEAHGMGAFPKPSGRSKKVKNIIFRSDPYVILLSGTPTPEAYSQMYHQVYFIPNNPFAHYKNFYQFANDYVGVVKKKIGGMYINDYSKGSKKIIEVMSPYTINFSQKDAGFVVETTEHVLEVDIKPETIRLINKLKRDLVVEGESEVILADTSVKLMTKVHQMCSGTIKFESGNSMVLDLSKAEFIKKTFRGFKIGIFYKFKEELNAIKEVFGDAICTDLDCFNTTDKNIALQIVSGREGISLRKANALVYYNIDFSATSYWQSRDRMTTKDRLKNDVYWIFSKGGIEKDIYKAVVKKKDYTLSHFRRKFINL